jgi:hypothetical protein
VQVLYHVGRLMAHWERRARAAADQDSVLDDFADDLAGHSEAHIAEACRRWRRREKFRPQVSELLALVVQVQAEEREMARRSRVLLALEPPRHWERLRPPPGEAPLMTPARRKELQDKIGTAHPFASVLRNLIARRKEGLAT